MFVQRPGQSGHACQLYRYNLSLQFAWAPARVAIACSYYFVATSILSNSQLWQVLRSSNLSSTHKKVKVNLSVSRRKTFDFNFKNRTQVSTYSTRLFCSAPCCIFNKIQQDKSTTKGIADHGGFSNYYSVLLLKIRPLPTRFPVEPTYLILFTH